MSNEAALAQRLEFMKLDKAAARERIRSVETERVVAA